MIGKELLFYSGCNRWKQQSPENGKYCLWRVNWTPTCLVPLTLVIFYLLKRFYKNVRAQGICSCWNSQPSFYTRKTNIQKFNKRELDLTLFLDLRLVKRGCYKYIQIACIFISNSIAADSLLTSIFGITTQLARKGSVASA